MKMPGFNADASLYRSAGNYRMRANGFSAVIYSSVMPQQTISLNSLRVMDDLSRYGSVAFCWPPPWPPICLVPERLRMALLGLYTGK
jgi:hypothetical protein